MPIIDINHMPAGGFEYEEPLLHWKTPNPYLPFTMIARQIQTVRVANPKSGLNPSFDACCKDLDTYTCKRLEYNPRWCVQVPGKSLDVQRGATKAKPSCGVCGAKKRRKKSG